MTETLSMRERIARAPQTIRAKLAPLLLSCHQRRRGLAADGQYRTLYIIRCRTCGIERMVTPGSPVYCFARDAAIREEKDANR